MCIGMTWSLVIQVFSGYVHVCSKLLSVHLIADGGRSTYYMCLPCYLFHSTGWYMSDVAILFIYVYVLTGHFNIIVTLFFPGYTECCEILNRRYHMEQ